MALLGSLALPPGLKDKKRCVSNTREHHRQNIVAAISPTPLTNCSGAGREVTTAAWEARNQKEKVLRSSWQDKGAPPGPPSLAPDPLLSHLIYKAPERKQARESKHQAQRTASAAREGRAQLGRANRVGLN